MGGVLPKFTHDFVRRHQDVDHLPRPQSAGAFQQQSELRWEMGGGRLPIQRGRSSDGGPVPPLGTPRSAIARQIRECAGWFHCASVQDGAQRVPSVRGGRVCAMEESEGDQTCAHAEIGLSLFAGHASSDRRCALTWMGRVPARGVRGRRGDGTGGLMG